MPRPFFTVSKRWIVPALLLLTAAVAAFFWDALTHNAVSLYHLVTDRASVEHLLDTFGAFAPVMFILMQIFQVLVAPVPGEVSGLIGGYLFGAVNGFLLSSIGLSIGSWLNFAIGRVLGKKFIRKLIPGRTLDRIEKLLKRQGVIVVFVLFLFPGFPKDYLCLFLGLSSLPLAVFMLLSSVGRMPGTLLLSLQGAALNGEMYDIFFALLLVCLLAVALSYRYREKIYRWVDKMNHNV